MSFGWLVVGWLVTRMYRDETAGRIELPLVSGVSLGQCHIVLDGDQQPASLTLYWAH